MAKRVVFDDLNSVLHFLLGITSCITMHFMPIATLFVVSAYILYQVFEREKQLNKLGDFIEFNTGFILGLSVSKILGVWG